MSISRNQLNLLAALAVLATSSAAFASGDPSIECSAGKFNVSFYPSSTGDDKNPYTIDQYTVFTFTKREKNWQWSRESALQDKLALQKFNAELQMYYTALRNHTLPAGTPTPEAPKTTPRFLYKSVEWTPGVNPNDKVIWGSDGHLEANVYDNKGNKFELDVAFVPTTGRTLADETYYGTLKFNVALDLPADPSAPAPNNQPYRFEQGLYRNVKCNYRNN